MRKLPDGTILQFLATAPHTAEKDYPIVWLQPFPNECLNVSVTCEAMTADPTSDNWYQLRSFTTSGAVINRQSSLVNNNPTRAHVMAIGY